MVSRVVGGIGQFLVFLSGLAIAVSGTAVFLSQQTVVEERGVDKLGWGVFVVAGLWLAWVSMRRLLKGERFFQLPDRELDGLSAAGLLSVSVLAFSYAAGYVSLTLNMTWCDDVSLFSGGVGVLLVALVEVVGVGVLIRGSLQRLVTRIKGHPKPGSE